MNKNNKSTTPNSSMASAATNASRSASETSGHRYSTPLSRSQLSCLLRSEFRALQTLPSPPSKGGGQDSMCGLSQFERPRMAVHEGAHGGMRRIDYLVLHCSDTRPDQDFTVEALQRCHAQRGFGKYPGYHIYVRRDGTCYYTRPISLRGCHVKGYNSFSIGVCYEGGHAPKGSIHKYEDNRTPAQREALQEVFATLHELFPHAKVVGHNEFGVAKACPCLSQADMEAFRCEIERG